MEVEVTPAAQKEIEDLPRAMVDRVYSVLERLTAWPEVSGAKWLTGDWKGHARIRTGDYRVVFRLAKQDTQIEVVRVAHRRDVYAD